MDIWRIHTQHSDPSSRIPGDPPNPLGTPLPPDPTVPALMGPTTRPFNHPQRLQPAHHLHGLYQARFPPPRCPTTYCTHLPPSPPSSQAFLLEATILTAQANMTSLLKFTPHFHHFSASGHAQFPRCRFCGSEVAELLPPTGYVAHHSKIELYYLPRRVLSVTWFWFFS